MCRPLRPGAFAGTWIDTPDVSCVHWLAGVLPIWPTSSRSLQRSGEVNALKPCLVTYTRM